MPPARPLRGSAPDDRPTRVLGLDEAGRGSVLGPLVIGGFACEIGSVERLRAIGVRDSKLLPAPRRTALHDALAGLGERFSVSFPPERVDAAVDHRGLNRLEADGFARIVRMARPDVVYVDACEVDGERFGREIAAKAGHRGEIVARNHADRDLPLVGAASIVAKVRRDAALARLEARVGTPIGSGYPSDPETRNYLARILRPGGATPAWVRRSWKTTATVMAERSRTTLDRFGP